MAMFLVTLKPMPADEVKSAWGKVCSASVGSEAKMDKAYVDHDRGQAVCCWSAPDRVTIERLFEKAGVTPELIREVTVYPG